MLVRRSEQHKVVCRAVVARRPLDVEVLAGVDLDARGGRVDPLPARAHRGRACGAAAPRGTLARVVGRRDRRAADASSAGKPLAEARKRRAAIERPSVGSNAQTACTATIVSGAHEQNNL